MALNLLEYSQLAQHRENSTNAVSVYSTDANQTVQVFIKIANTAIVNVKCSVYHDNYGSTYDETTILVSEVVLQPGSFIEIDHIFMSEETGNLAVKSSVANALTVTVYGIIRSS